MTFESSVIKAISETMTCDKCPYPCKSRENGSQANCVMQWCGILSKIDPNCDWAEVRYEIAKCETT